MRNLIFLGDKTTAGGTVLEGVQTGFHENKLVSFHGAQVHCPACKSNGIIIGDGPTMPMTFNGKQVALENDICSCQCDPSPRLIASQSTMTLGVDGNAGTNGGNAAAGSQSDSRARVPSSGPYNEQVRIIDDNGAPMLNVPYFIEDEDGRTYQGVTDETGTCPRVFTRKKQKLTITYGVQALELWKES